ncbi:MAG: oxidoreductase [Bdellovibrionaceae bacterium]|nr:oxidoreductase [Bdellovibrio sp.]
MRTAVVIGATGLVGQLLVDKLAHARSWTNILAISRRPVTWSHPKIRGLVFDFKGWSELELQIRSFSGHQPTDFFCALGTTIGKAKSKAAFKKVDHDDVVLFAKMARNARAEKLLVVSAKGADAESKVFYNRIKGQMETDVQKEFAGFVRFARPSLLLGDRKEFRLAERIAILAAPLYSPLLTGKLAAYKPIRADCVAEALIAIANNKLSSSIIIENEELIKICKE